MSWITDGARWIWGRFTGRNLQGAPDPAAEVSRVGIFAVNEMLYAGTVYQTAARGGALLDVLKGYIGAQYQDVNKFKIKPMFMPFKEIVDTYLNILPGTWGKELKPADEFDGKPINPQLTEPLRRIWRASNLDTEKATLIRWAANMGTVGMRVATLTRDGQPAADQPVIYIDHPARIFNFEQDSTGNVTAVCLKYDKSVNDGTLADPKWRTVKVVETLDKEGFSRKEDKTEQLTDSERRNELGFCPYVILRHKDNGTPWGDWAYKGSEGPVHEINWRISRQSKSIGRNEFPKWFGAAGGKAPTTDVQMGDESMTYVQIAPDTPNPILQAIVPDINQADAMAFWMQLRDMIRGNQPELNLNDVKLLAGVSGETLQQVIKPTEQALAVVLPNYQHALIRALQMALSAGVVAGSWDLGTGGNTAEAGDRAYQSGAESFELAKYSLLPQTVTQQVAEAQAQEAAKMSKMALAKQAQGIVDELEQLILAGYTEADARAILERKRDAVPVESL